MRRIQPALARVTAKIAGGLHLPADATGDCHLFTENLYKLCQEKGVQFHFNQTISRIDHNGLRIKAVETETGRFEADAVVCALGCFQPGLCWRSWISICPFIPSKAIP